MPAKVFVSYCHRDERHRERLGVHLSSLKQQGKIAEWHDRKIAPGQDWEAQINDQLLEADIILLLITADFIASEYCYSRELKNGLDRESRKEAVVIPILVKPCDWKGAPFGYLQALPKDARPVTKWTNRDDAWAKVAEGIRTAVEILKKPPSAPPPKHARTEQPKPAQVSPPAAHSAKTGDLAEEIRAILPEATQLSETEMSSIFRGLDPVHGEVTLKVLKVAVADSLGWLASPDYRIVLGDRLLRSGTTESGQAYFLFKFVEGISIADTIRPGNVIRGALLDDIAMQVLRQLEALNLASPDAVHRDVTPGNLILSFTNGRAVVQLIDYESACFASEPQLPVRAYGFSAPEQAEGRAVPSSDLFSLVSSLYFLAEGRLASSGPAASSGFPPDAFGVFTEFEELFGPRALLKCWDVNHERRPSSAAKFLEEGAQPSTRIMSPPRPLGTYFHGSQAVELFDQRYQVRN